jgi:large repetitive protein
MSAVRDRSLILFTAAALVAMGALAVLSLAASATYVYVDDSFTSDTPASHLWTTVQKGVDDAASNDTVFVYNGTYQENVTVYRNYITVQGESRDGVVIDRQSLNGVPVVNVKGNHATFQNLTLKRGTYGVYINPGYNNGTLDNITVTLINYDCVYLNQAHDWTMHDVDASSCGYGGFDIVGNPLYNIHMWSISVTTTTTYDGLYFYYVSGAWVSNVTLKSTGRAAIWLQNSADLHFSNFRINTTGNYGGVYIYSTLSDSSFDNGSIHATGNWAFYSYDTHSCSLDNVTLEAGSWGGFDFGGLSTGWRWRNVLINTTSSPMYFYYNSPAVLAYFEHDIDASNTIRGVPIMYIVNATGGSFSGPASFLAVVNSTGVDVTVNTTISGLDDGVFILFTNSSTIRDINSSGNGWNFVIERSNNNTFANFSQTYMRATSYYGGIYLYASSYNLFTGGTWRNTSLYGYAVDVRASSGSHYNTFANVSCFGWNTCFYFGTDTEGNRLAGSSVTGPYYGVYANYAASFEVGGSTFTNVYYYAVYGYWYSATAPLTRTWIHNNTFNHTTYYYAVYLYGHGGALIENNSINDSSTAIYGSTLNNLVIQNNVINASHDAAIRGDNSDYWVISGNTLTNSTNEGIFLYRDSYWRLRSNNISNQTQPVALSLDASIQVRWANHDVDASNMFNGLPPLWIVNATSGTFTGSYGWIVIDNSSNVSVTSTSSLARNQAGVLLVGVNDSTVSGVNASANTWGFEAWLSARNTVSDSRFALNTGGGMYFWGSDWNTVLRATLRPDTFRADIGLDVDTGSSNLTFESGDCAQFSTCIQANVGTADLRVLNSTLNDSYYEVYSYQAFGPWVMGNVMNSSYYYQIYLGYTSSPQTQGYRISNNTMGQAYYYDIYCYFCGRGLIEDNVLSGADYGIYLYNGQGGIIARNRIYGMVSGGIDGYFSDYRLLIDNTIANSAGSSAGIRIENSKFWTLRGNNITNQTAPIRLVFSVPVTDIGYGMHDVDASNIANGNPIRFFVNATGTSFTGTAGLIIATNSSGLNITATNPVTRGQGGIFLLATNWSTFATTNLSQNEWGSISYLSNNNTFADLTYWKNSLGGASFAYSDWNRVQGGNFTPDTPYSDAGVQFDVLARNNTVSSNISGFTEDIYMSATTAFDNGVDGGSYGTAYYGIYSYAYAGTRAEHANFTDDYYYHVFIQGGGPSTGFGRIANNTMHRTNYHSIYLYSVGSGLIADNLFNGSGQEGIYFYSTTGVTVARNTFTNGTDYALYGYFASSLTVTDNIVTRSHAGVYFYESRYWTFNNNSIFNLTGSQPYAVYFASPDPVIDETLFMHTWTTDNTINGGPVRYYVNATGVTFSGPAGWIVAVNSTFMDLSSTTVMRQNYNGALFVKVFNSTLRNTVLNGSYEGAALFWGADNHIVNISTNASYFGIYLSNNTRATLEGVFVSNATQYGLYAYQSTRLNITNSTFFRNYYGVYLEYRSQYVNITGSLFDSQGYIGIYTEATDDVRIVGNTILSSVYFGIYLGGNSGDQVNRDLISGNRMNNAGNYDAVILYWTYSSVVENNNITNSSNIAIELSSSNANTIRGNTLRFQYYAYYLSSSDSNTYLDGTVSNSSYTIYLASSADFNLFYHNNFYTANNSMYDIGTSNVFDNGYPSGGNYWSNTTHTDIYKGAAQSTAGPDGINDTSLILPYARVDSYPLSEPWPPYVTLVGPLNGSVIRAGVTLDLNISFYFDTVQVALNNGTTTNLTTPFDISTGGLADGDLFVQIWANDSTGYTQQPWFLIVIDSTAPTITADSPAVGGTYPVGTQLNFTVADPHLAANVTWNNGASNISLAAPWDISTSGWAEGDYNITIAAWDTVGNGRTSTFLFKLDSTAPVITLNSPSNNSFIAVGTTIDLTVADVHLSTVTWNNGSGPNLLSAPWDISTAGWGSATFNITVFANDTAGFSTTRVFTFTIDATAPTITLNSPSNNSVFEPGQTLDFDVADSNLAGATWDTGSGASALVAPYDISTSGWADGAYDVTIRANDTSGNVATRVFHFEVDFTAPSIVMVSPANNSFISPGTTIDFTVTDAHLSSATWTNGSGSNALSAPFDISTSGWAEGNYTVTVNATDVLGHTASRSLFVKIDSVAPTITLNSPSNNSFISPGATIDLSVADANLNTVNWTTGGAPTALASPFDINTTGWADAVYTVRVNATDLAGNLRFASFTFTVDGGPPSITLNAPANLSYITAGTTIDLTVIDGNLNSVNWTTGGAPASLASPYDISTTGWADGLYTVRVNATDLAGNLRFASFTFTVDSTPPSVTLNTPANGSYIVAGATIDLAVSDANLNVVNWTTSGAPASLASPYDISTTGWADGVYIVRVNATDLAGNRRFSSFTFTVDSTPPTISLNSPANNSYLAAGTAIDLSVTDANLNIVSWTIAGAPTTLSSPFDINTTGWADGLYTVRVNATDLAGNQRFASFGFTLDSTLPSVSLVTPSAGATVRAGALLDFAVSDTNLNTVAWDNGGAPATLASPYDLTTTGWADGTYTVTVRATDLAGNVRQVAVQIQVDSTPPTITLNSPSAGAVVPAATTIDVSVADTNLSTVTFGNGSGPFALVSPYDISTAGWADANYSISVHAMDSAGNEAWLNFTIVIDSTVPGITLVSPANGSVVRAGTLLVWTISDANLRNASYNNGTADLALGAPFQINTTGYFDRNYNVTLFATDLAGNAVGRLFNFTIDSTPPQVQLLSPANNTWLAAGVLIDFAVSDAHLTALNVTLDGAPLTLFAGYDYNSTNLTDGTHTFVIDASDAAGNSRQLISLFRVDKTPPRISVLPASGSWVASGTVWTFTITEANLQRAEWKVFGTPSFTPFAANFTIDTSGWSDGSYDYVVGAVDFAGNGVQLRTNITIDSTAPSVDSLTLTPSVHYIKRGVPIVFRVSGETSPYTAVLFVRGVQVPVVDDGSGSFSFTFKAEPEDNSDYDFLFRVVDAAGNSNEITRVVLLDSTPPELPATFPMAYGGNEDTPFAFKGSATDFTAPADELNYTWQFDAGSRLQVLETVYGQNTTWTFTDPGQYAINVIVTDPAGNANGTIFNITIFDITPPSLSLPVTFYDVDEDTPVNINQTSIDNGNGTLNWTWRSPAANLTSNGPNITWIFTTPGLYNITVTVTDPQNNSAVGFVVVNVRDITPPDVQISGPSVVDVLIPALFRANATDNDPRYPASNWSFEWRFHKAAGIDIRFGRNVTFIDADGEVVTVELRVTDASQNEGTNTTSLTVNEPPVVGTPPTTEVGENNAWTWSPNATDPENGSINISLVDGPPGMQVVGGTVVWTPGPGSANDYNVTVGISDGLTTVYRTFKLYVVDPAVLAGNHKPVFESEPPADAAVSRTYLYDIKVRDDDNDPISIVISGLDGYGYDAITGRLSWLPPWQPSPNEVFERLVPVTITAFDGKQSTTQDFVIRFRNPPNQWPDYWNEGFSIGDVTQHDILRYNISQYWRDADDASRNLSFAVNATDPSVKAQVNSIIGWSVEVDGQGSAWLVIEVKGQGSAVFNFVARDPSNARSSNATVTIHARPAVSNAPAALPWWIWLIIAGGAIGLAFSLWRSRSASQVARSALETASKAPTERVIIQQAPLAAGAEKRKDTFVIEGALIIYTDGRMVFSKLDAGDVKLEDPELVSSMFSAVQSFIKDSFQAQGELNRLGFGENTILMERGTSIFMAAIIYGEPTNELTDAMRETIRTIENAYAGIIEEWDGSTTSLEAIDQYVEPFFALTAGRSREDVKAALTEKVVKMPSELEFFQGFVRLKCGVKNDTESVITKVTVSIDFNEDVLRLHHIEPDTYKFQGSEVQLGVLNPGEKVSVAYYFDPQICTESQIDGVGRYRDAKGAVHSIAMKTRKAEVVCPIFFTKEHANTAMLKRLVEGELDQRDSKVYTITQLPEGLKWSEVFSLAKEVVLGHDVHLVRDFVVEEPYHGEAWFYGETKVKGYKIVIRASVIADGSKLEFFAASTQIRAITGLLAEFNHTLTALIGRKYATLKLKSEFGDDIKQDIQKKSLMGKMGQAELEGGETDQEPR